MSAARNLAFVLCCLAWRPAMAAAPLSTPIDTSIVQTQEQMTVWGHRRFSLAPTARPDMVAPDAGTGFGPGTRIGIVRIEGGPFHAGLSNGVSGGLSIPVPGVRGLDFIADLTGTRDDVSPAGTTGAAAAIMGLRLKF